MTTDPMHALRAANPAPTVGPYGPARAADLLDRATAAPPAPGTRRRIRRMSATGAAAALAVVGVGTGGVAYAVLTQSASSTVLLSCSAGLDRELYDPARQGGGSMHSISGDPVADCAAEYERLEGYVPALVGYDTGESYVGVLPADWPAPPGWTALPGNFRNDPVRLELKQRLDDLVEGPESGCVTADEAEALARRDLADLGLSGWTVERLTQADRADGMQWCAKAWVDEGPQQKILIQGLEGGFGLAENDGQAPIRRVRDQLRAGIVDACVTLEQAEARANEALVANGLALEDAHVITITDPGSSCTRVDFVPGGLAVVVLRGPSS